MRVCDICGGTFNAIDWSNHVTAHLSQQERDVLREQMREERNPKPLPPDEEVFKGFMDT